MEPLAFALAGFVECALVVALVAPDRVTRARWPRWATLLFAAAAGGALALASGSAEAAARAFVVGAAFGTALGMRLRGQAATVDAATIAYTTTLLWLALTWNGLDALLMPGSLLPFPLLAGTAGVLLLLLMGDACPRALKACTYAWNMVVMLALTFGVVMAHVLPGAEGTRVASLVAGTSMAAVLVQVGGVLTTLAAQIRPARAWLSRRGIATNADLFARRVSGAPASARRVLVLVSAPLVAAALVRVVPVTDPATLLAAGLAAVPFVGARPRGDGEPAPTASIEGEATP